MKAYPLQGLHQVRTGKVQEREQELAERAVEVHQAFERVRTAASRLEQEQERQRELEATERTRADAGLARAEDFQRAASYRVVTEQRLEQLRSNLQVAQQGLERAEQAQGQAEAALLEARAEQKVIERHRENFLAGQLKQEEAQQEEAALENWSARETERRHS